MNINNIIILISAIINALTALSHFSIKITIKLKAKHQKKIAEKLKLLQEKKQFNLWKEKQAMLTKTPFQKYVENHFSNKENNYIDKKTPINPTKI